MVINFYVFNIDITQVTVEVNPEYHPKIIGRSGGIINKLRKGNNVPPPQMYVQVFILISTVEQVLRSRPPFSGSGNRQKFKTKFILSYLIFLLRAASFGAVPAPKSYLFKNFQGSI